LVTKAGAAKIPISDSRVFRLPLAVPQDLIQQARGNAFEEPYYFGDYLDVPPITMNIG